MRLQNTLRREINIKGTGLHTGRQINMRLRPAPRDTGIVFIRTDKSDVQIKASVASVADTTFATTLASNGVRVGTVEHLLSVFMALQIDNVYIELDGPEVPIMDGSALPFVSKIMECGIARQAKGLSYMRIIEPIVVMEGQGQIAITPYEGMRITQRVHYSHHLFGEQRFGIDITEKNFISELAPARTFGFLKDIEVLRSRGLIKGGSLENAIVLSDKEIVNKGKLRFKDEFVRHKILDTLGDISLLGLPIHGHIIANRSGHTLNIKLLKKILLSNNSWEIVSMTGAEAQAIGLTA
jgi:UDP-3-O-[3-hydroxymyristoyl] N-acetylglucosamine deacetylase